MVSAINQTTTTPTPDIRAIKQAQTQAVFNVLAAVLAARFVLLLSVIGSFCLTLIAIGAPDPFKLGALAIYVFAVVIPLIVLSIRS